MYWIKNYQSKGHERWLLEHRCAQLVELLLEEMQVATTRTVGRLHLTQLQTVIFPRDVDGRQALLLTCLEDSWQLPIRERNHDARTHLNRLDASTHRILPFYTLFLSQEAKLGHSHPFLFVIIESRLAAHCCCRLARGQLMGIPEGEGEQIYFAPNFLLSLFSSLSQLSIQRVSLLITSSVLFLPPQGVAAQRASADSAWRNTKIDLIDIRLSLSRIIPHEGRSVLRVQLLDWRGGGTQRLRVEGEEGVHAWKKR